MTTTINNDTDNDMDNDFNSDIAERVNKDVRNDFNNRQDSRVDISQKYILPPVYIYVYVHDISFVSIYSTSKPNTTRPNNR